MEIRRPSEEEGPEGRRHLEGVPTTCSRGGRLLLGTRVDYLILYYSEFLGSFMILVLLLGSS